MKTTLSILLLTSLALVAQNPAPAPEGGDVALKRLAPPGTTSPNPPAAPAAAASATPSPNVPPAPPAPVAPPPVPPPVATAPVAPVAHTPAAASEDDIPGVTFDWTAAELPEVLKIYAKLVGRTIIRPSNLPATPIVLETQTPLTRREAKQALEAVLALNNVAMIPVGEKFVKAVPIAEANTAGGAFNQFDATNLPEMGSYVTHIVQLKYVKPSEMVQVIQPFAKVPNSILPVESSQILVLRDYAENVKRMLEMIAKVDVSIPSEFISEVIPIKFAKVEDIAAALNSLSGGGGGTTVGGHSSGTGATGRTGGGTTGMNMGSRFNRSGYNQGMNTPQGNVGSTGTPSSGASFSERIQNIIKRASSSTGGSGDLQILGVTKIVADARSNSLLVFATRQDMEMIKDIVSKLDVVLAQVLIETIIMDVTLANNWQFGVSAAQSPHTFPKGNQGAGGFNNGNPFFDFLGGGATNLFPGNLTQTLPSGFNYWGKLGVGPSFDVAIKAAADDSRINVIQRPIIQTSHATPAEIFVGNTVPYVSSTYYGGGYAGGPSSSYQQLQVGISLSVTPFINADGLVVMQINETIDEISDYTTIDNNKVPNTTSRTLTAEVAVRDRETIMLGGFIRNSDLRSKSGVPYLKDIPLLGKLFSSSDSSKKRSELIVLMRPTVLRTPELAALQVNEEKKKLPGVIAAESSIAEDVNKQLKKSRKQGNGATDIYTPEQQLIFGQPGTNQPAAKP